MLVAVEATRLLREVRGIGRYVRALLPRLVAQRPGLRIALFAKSRADVAALGDIISRDALLCDRVDVHHVRGMARFAANVFWYPWNVADPVPARGAVVVTVHDVAPVALPDPRVLAWQKNFRWRRRYAAMARRATIIVADSTFTSDEIHRVLGVPRERMRVALLAADNGEILPPLGDAATLRRLGVTPPYLLSVGAADRRKNLAVLGRAMKRVVATHADATLALAGPRRDVEASLADAPWMRTLGFVSEDDLTVLYRNAAALVMPSSYEGFGLPVLEAMRVGTPVICARASSLPEVAGEAAEWVEPGDDAGLGAAIDRVLSDESLRARMSAASLAQAARFSWAETARLTLAAFDDAMRLCRPTPGSPHANQASEAVARR